MRRAFLLAAALAIPVSGASVALVSGGQAWAGGGITCTGFNGTITGTITLSGCTGGNTGGGSVAMPSSALATGGTVTWLSGSTTTIGQPMLTSTSNKHCPGYVKPVKHQPPPAEPTADKVSGSVTADNGDGIKVPGTYKGAVCIDQSGNITALKPLKAK